MIEFSCSGCGKSIFEPDDEQCQICAMTPQPATARKKPNYALPWIFLVFHVKSWVRVALGVVVGILIIVGIISLNTFRSSPSSSLYSSPQTPAVTPIPTPVARNTPADSGPGFPDLPRPLPVLAQIQMYTVVINGPGPGISMRVVLFLPHGEHAPASLPCIFIAPPRRELFYGSNDMPQLKQDEDFATYVGAGFAVLYYQLFGEEPESRFKAGVEEFIAYEAGAVNARRAVDFVLAKVPQVDPKRLFAVGRHQAGTVALCAAAADHRFRAVVAFAPICDAEAYHPEVVKFRTRMMPQLPDCLASISPMRKVHRIVCPVAIYYGSNDKLAVPFSDNQAFAAEMAAAGHRVQLQNTGDASNPTIEAGISFLDAHSAHAAQ